MEPFPVTAAGLDRASAVPLHHQLTLRLRQAILHGELRAGMQLPAEKHLAVQLGLARGTVRQALDGLVREGLLARRHGWGTFVSETPHGHNGSVSSTPATAAVQTAYLCALLTGDAGAAHQAVVQALQTGLDATSVAETVLRPAAEAIGEHWQTGAVSVAEEHRATAILERDLAELHRVEPWLPALGCVLVIGCITGDLHTLGCRLVADHFERQGWTVHYLGADVPTTAFVTLAHDVEADLIAVSATLPEHVPAVAALVQAVNASRPVLVGGRPFQDDPELAPSLGAWAQAATAMEAVRRAGTLVTAVRVPGSPSGEGSIPVGEAAPIDDEQRSG